MGRPRLAPGTAGAIATSKIGEGWVARCWYREWSGRRRKIERRGPSKAKAVAALKAAVAALTRDGMKDTSTLDTRLTALCQTFLERKREDGRSARTMTNYEAVGRIITGPAGIGELTIRETTPGVLSRFLRQVRQQNGPGQEKTTRSVLSGMFTLAVEDGTINSNPVKQLGRMERPKPNGAPAIPLDQVPALRAKIATDSILNDYDLTDVFLLQLGTGLRIGEALALRWQDLDLDKGTITITGTMTRIKGEGMKRQDRPKTDASLRTITAPATIIDLLKRRTPRSDLVFPDLDGKPRDPNSVERQLRLRRDDLGYPTLTTHSFRKTVATALDSAGLTARAIADYLGHSQPSTTANVYMARNLDTSNAADAMQAVIESGE